MFMSVSIVDDLDIVLNWFGFVIFFMVGLMKLEIIKFLVSFDNVGVSEIGFSFFLGLVICFIFGRGVIFVNF